VEEDFVEIHVSKNVSMNFCLQVYPGTRRVSDYCPSIYSLPNYKSFSRCRKGNSDSRY